MMGVQICDWLLCRDGFTAYASQTSVRRKRNRQSEEIQRTNKDAPDEPMNVSDT